MKKNENIKIEKILQSADDIRRASPRPFFFTRLEARMANKKTTWDRISFFVTRPAVIIAGICLIIVTNVMVIFSSPDFKASANNQGQEIATLDEYSQVSSSFYEFVNTNP